MKRLRKEMHWDGPFLTMDGAIRLNEKLSGRLDRRRWAPFKERWAAERKRCKEKQALDGRENVVRNSAQPSEEE